MLIIPRRNRGGKNFTPCSKCGVLMKDVPANRQYCTNCNRDLKRERDRLRYRKQNGLPLDFDTGKIHCHKKERVCSYSGQKAFGIINPIEQANWVGEANPCLFQKCTLHKPLKRKRRKL